MSENKQIKNFVDLNPFKSIHELEMSRDYVTHQTNYKKTKKFNEKNKELIEYNI